MSRKTKKHHRKSHSRSRSRSRSSAIQTMPELRQAFDYIDTFVKQRIQSGVSKEQLTKELRREWLRVFSKTLQKKNATAFVEHMMEQTSKRRGLRGTRKRTHGGMAPFMDSTTQAGTYLASGKPPTDSGHLPLASGAQSAYGSFTSYLSKGLQFPQQSAGSDPVEGQTKYPTSAPNATNEVSFPTMKGGRRRRLHGGSTLMGSLLQQFTTRPIPSSIPSSSGQDAQTAWYGRSIGPSPDQVQRNPDYQLKDTMFPKMVNVKIDV